MALGAIAGLPLYLTGSLVGGYIGLQNGIMVGVPLSVFTITRRVATVYGWAFAVSAAVTAIPTLVVRVTMWGYDAPTGEGVFLIYSASTIAYLVGGVLGKR